jgi:hypothetical protein
LAYRDKRAHKVQQELKASWAFKAKSGLKVLLELKVLRVLWVKLAYKDTRVPREPPVLLEIKAL